ncbi:MAG TPA: MFS transporter [Nitrosopumilaceae archaeon]|nr:MFS transporter [Nitrosopumilaceae archaeon]
MSFAQGRKWIWYLLPSQITAEGLRTVIPLYIIFLGGGINEVAVIVALHYGASAFGSLFWGRIIDRFHVRRTVLLISLSATLLSCVWLYFTKDLGLLLVISPIIGFFIVGKNPVTHLLVMESAPKNQWSWLFARISIIATLGMLGAMVIGTVWSVYFDLGPYFLICALSSGIAIVFTNTIKESVFHLERGSIAHSIQGLRYSFSHFHYVFPKIPELYDYKHIITIFKGKVSHEIGILFLSTFLFYLGSNIYFTAYTPFLKHFGFSDSTVFLVYTIQTITMITIFFVAPKIIAKFGEERSTMIAYVPRVAAVLVAGFVVPFMFGGGVFVLSIISVCLMVLAFSIFSTSSSMILFKSIPQGFEGKYLGVNSSVTGIGVFIGALVTGKITSSFGYTISFLVSAIVLVMAFVLFRVYLHYKLSHNTV